MDDPERRSGGPGKPSEPVEIQRNKESFVERVGMTGLLGGAAAVITAVAALISSFSHVRSPASEAAHPPAASTAAMAGPGPSSDFVISDYWSGIPEGTSQPLIFHIFADSKAVLGTMRNPCQGDLVVPIESGTWDGTRLVVHVTRVASNVPLTLDVNRAGDRLEGSVVQVPFDGHITLRRGEIPCPVQPEPKEPAQKE